GVQAFRQLPEPQALAAPNKGVSNILSKSEDEVPPNVDASLLVVAAEKARGSAVAAAESEVAPLAAARDYRASLARLAAL
ncbi:glycine--tRNA ligase subunit beta, partial [Pseudomonas aeruginosa]